MKSQTLQQATLVLLLGTNLGNRIAYLEQAIIQLQKVFGNIIIKSSIYETAAWGKINQPNFLNQVVIHNTNFSAHQCIQKILAIEKELGRERIEKMGPRTIDIDILFYDNEIIKTKNLTIPHPHLQNRKFVLVPLNEIIPNYMHPILSKSVKVLLQECSDTLNVKKF